MISDTQKTESDGLLRAAFDAAPLEVREFIELGGFDQAVAVLRKDAGLNTEAADKAELEILLALLGVTNAADLETNLVERAGLTAEQLAPTMAISVAYIFSPLTEEEIPEEGSDLLPMEQPPHELTLVPERTQTILRPMTKEVTAPPYPKPSTRAQPVASPLSAAPVSESPLSSFHANLAPAPQVVAATPPPAPVPPTKAPTKPASATMHPMETFHARTMASDIEAMGGAQKMSAAPVRPITPPPAPPRYAPIAATEPVPTPTPEPAPPSAAQSVHTDLKEYGIDPYREPIA